MPEHNDCRGSQEPEEVSLHTRSVQRVNFASAQNDVAIVEEITVENRKGNALTEVRITLRAAPPVIRKRIWIVDRVAPGSRFPIRNLHTPLDIERLAGLDEAEIGELEFRLEAKGLPPVIEKRRIELLARDEWGGLDDMDRLLAAFVSPNDPAVARILKDAALLMEKAGHDSSINGYQSGDPGRAYILAGAIWSAATGLNLDYAEPPASFEREGQKIRGPSRIVGEGLATSLDSTLFLAAAFEAAGLNTAVLFSRDHAWVGFWVVKQDFGHVTEPDAIVVRKAAQAKEFFPVETTLLTRRPPIGFTQAVDEGGRRLSRNRDSEFVMAVDIARSRAVRIRPLASRRIADPGASDGIEETVPAALPQVPDFGSLPNDTVDETPGTPQGRIDRWQRKLLDLTLRNRLLNHRDTQKSLPFRCPKVAEFEDGLSAGRKFKWISLNDNAPIGDRTLSPEDRQRIEEEFIRREFEREQIVVPLTHHEMNKRLIELHRTAKRDMQEGGTNTLFIAAGFLRYRKNGRDSKSHCAPLILIPARLERSSARSPYRIGHHEDDTRINYTLLEFLKRDFDLEIPELQGDLPRDRNGIDVPSIFGIMRQKVRDIDSFEVVEDLALSIFSFAKYLMWKDLVDRSDQLRQNRLVRHLIDGTRETQEETGDPAPVPSEEIDRRSPRELLTPCPADSSQLAAILAASKGHDFILVGPPGTGKSQTITNIIAQCLGEGKTVLFVAEKTAALNVVHRRLVNKGLGESVMELHSNKTDRKSVLHQLERAWERASGSSEEKWIQVTEKLRIQRDQLNAYVESLHAKGTQGFSVFDAISLVAPGTPPFAISFASKDAHDKKSYERLAGLASDLGRTYAVVGNGPRIPLIQDVEWSFQWEKDLLAVVKSLRSELYNLEGAEQSFASELGLRRDPGLEAVRLARIRALAPRTEKGAVDISSVPEIPRKNLLSLSESLAADIRNLAEAGSETTAQYEHEEVCRMPLEQLDGGWREDQTKFWPFSAWAKRRIRKLLQTYAVGGTADPATDLQPLFRMRDLYNAIIDNPLVPASQSDGAIDAESSTEVIRQAIAFRSARNGLINDIEDKARFESACSELLTASEGSTMGALRTCLAAIKAADDKAREFNRLKGDCPVSSGDAENADKISGSRPDPPGIPHSVADFDTELATIESERAHLADWAKWKQKSKEGIAAGLGTLVHAIENGEIGKDAETAFKRAYAAWWLPLAMDANDNLRSFTYWNHEDMIDAFRKLDEEAAKIAPREVMRRITHGLPSRDIVPRKSELGILRHQLNLRRPSMPIRQLLSNLPETLGKLAPCVLMSPLSVAQYLPPNHATFDIVIFDEASQITTWDAIGVIARGRQTIIVGDPKQLPPTNFFGRTDDEDKDFPETERDAPSILDEAASSGIRNHHLNWHYRSRCESLIAFSNHFYYGNKLVTFPSPSTDSTAIRFHRINGTYARGSGRVNQDEAKVIAGMVEQRLGTWLDVPEQERPTLGIITFNIQQQTLILDLLDEVRRKNPRLEWFFSDDRVEPVIVKNLENIQGDERDVMLFSITFGPEIDGRISMNFGAVNNMGGEKRLNVAITRARRELHVFSSITAEDVDLSRTNAQGARDLKVFLDYAERGSVVLPVRDKDSIGPAECPFEEAVADTLRARG